MNTENNSREATHEINEPAEIDEVCEPESADDPPPPDGLRSRFLRALYYWTLSRM